MCGSGRLHRLLFLHLGICGGALLNASIERAVRITLVDCDCTVAPAEITSGIPRHSLAAYVSPLPAASCREVAGAPVDGRP